MKPVMTRCPYCGELTERGGKCLPFVDFFHGNIVACYPYKPPKHWWEGLQWTAEERAQLEELHRGRLDALKSMNRVWDSIHRPSTLKYEQDVQREVDKALKSRPKTIAYRITKAQKFLHKTLRKLMLTNKKEKQFNAKIDRIDSRINAVVSTLNAHERWLINLEDRTPSSKSGVLYPTSAGPEAYHPLKIRIKELEEKCAMLEEEKRLEREKFASGYERAKRQADEYELQCGALKEELAAMKEAAMPTNTYRVVLADRGDDILVGAKRYQRLGSEYVFFGADRIAVAQFNHNNVVGIVIDPATKNRGAK